MYKKYVYIGLSCLALLGTVIWISYQKKKNQEYMERSFQTQDSTHDTVFVDKVVVDSIQLQKMQDSITILNNMIKNNIQKPITNKKQNEKVNNISNYSSKQFNEFLSDRYKDRK